MIVPFYTSGDWFAVVTDGSIALLPSSTDHGLVLEVWESLREGAGLTDQVHLLLRDGIAHLPPFALVNVEGGRVHAIVRGGVEVDVRTADGLHVISAARVSTWTEESVADATRVAVRSPGRGAVDGREALPVLSAVVRAAAVQIELGTGPADGAGHSRARRAAAAAPAGRRDAPVEEAPAATASPDIAADDIAPDADSMAPATDGLAPDADSMAPAAPSGVPAEDHDGLTILSSDVVALRRQLPDWAGDAVPGPLAVPATRMPPPAKLLLSSGLVVALNRPVLLGRAPAVSRVSNREIPRLVTVASPDQDISRTHAEIRMDGEEVVVTDLRSTNGVLLLRQGAGPQRLHPGEPTVVEPGVVVDLGEGVTFTVERGM